MRQIKTLPVMQAGFNLKHNAVLFGEVVLRSGGGDFVAFVCWSASRDSASVPSSQLDVVSTAARVEVLPTQLLADML